MKQDGSCESGWCLRQQKVSFRHPEGPAELSKVGSKLDTRFVLISKCDTIILQSGSDVLLITATDSTDKSVLSSDDTSL